MTTTMPRRVLVVSLGSVALGALLLPSCGGQDTPTNPTTTVSPTPATTTTTMTAGPVMNNPVYPKSCQGVPVGTGTSLNCRQTNPNFFNNVKDALAVATTSIYHDPASGQNFQVVDDRNHILVASEYFRIVNDQLDKQGLCSVYDGEEISVRDSRGSYNENYDILTAEGGSWIHYGATCSPATPIPPLPIFPGQRDPNCRLAPSVSFFCGNESPVYDDEIFAGLDEIIAADRALATPLIFNFNDRLAGFDYGWKIKDDGAYVAAVFRMLKSKGFCAILDGDEFNIKRTNVFSETYDLTNAEGYSIRLYSATCRDALF